MKIQSNQTRKQMRKVCHLAIKSFIFPLRNSHCLNEVVGGDIR